MLTQLNPPLPLNVIAAAGWNGPVGSAVCHFVIDYGIEAELIFVVFMDNTGQCWSVPNRFIRAQKNRTAIRNNPEQ
jgi:hypothetical protein